MHERAPCVTNRAELPPKMTDRLQIIDLVTNGPLKTGCRRKRVEDLLDYMGTWRHKRLKATIEGREIYSVSTCTHVASRILLDLHVHSLP